MSTSQAEPAEREPRWSHSYLVDGLSIDDAAAKVADAVNLLLDERESSFVGRYFRYRDAEVELQVKLNWIDGEGETIQPDLPEGVFIRYSSPQEDQLAAQLETIPEAHFFGKSRYR